jgi:hypothetical protein
VEQQNGGENPSPARRLYQASSSRRGATSWLSLFVMLVIVVAAAYLWSLPRDLPPSQPKTLKVAVADSSGSIAVPDSSRAEGGGVIPSSGNTVPQAFIAPAPAFQNPGTVPIGSFLDYARQMQFDPARGLDLSLAADDKGNARIIRIAPLTNLRQLDSTAFAEGRIIARIQTDAAYSDLSLHNGDNYLWVRGQLGSPIRAELWSTTAFAAPKSLILNFSPRPPPDAPSGKDAFWSGADSSNKVLWIVCGHGWCHS